MSLDSDIRLLAQVRLFSVLEHEHLRLLAFGAEARALDERALLYRAGHKSEGGYVVVRGCIDLLSGREGELVSHNGPASLIGEMALISEVENAATAIAAEPTQVLKIPRPLFRRMLSEYPAIAEALRARLTGELTHFVSRLDTIRAKLDHADDLIGRRKPS